MNRLLLLASFALVSACTTYKLWNEAGSDQDARTVDLSYEYRKYESPQLDERAGVEMARERCKDWGYPNARRKGENRAVHRRHRDRLQQVARDATVSVR